MGEMQVDVAAALGAGFVLVVILAAVVRRRRSNEAQSVAGYRQTLEVLGHLGGTDRGIRPHLRDASSPNPASHGAGAQDVLSPKSVPNAEGGPRPLPHGRLVAGEASTFDDDVGTEPPRRGPVELVGAPAGRDRSLIAMQHSGRRLGGPAAVLALILAAGGVAAYMVVRSHHVTPPPRHDASSHSNRPSTVPPAAPTKYTAVSSTGSSATYAPDTATYSLTIGATTSDCWMSVTASSGTTVLAQTFAAGATASLSLTGHTTIVIGAPQSAKLLIGGVPVVLPSTAGGPFTVTLAPT
jgi:hypothetical protein